MLFLGTKRVECPNCPKRETRRGPLGPELYCVERSWHGTGSDLGECPECKGTFMVHYEVSEVTEF